MVLHINLCSAAKNQTVAYDYVCLGDPSKSCFMNSHGRSLPFYTRVTKSDQSTFGKCCYSLPKETEIPVVHTHSMVCPYPPLLPILFPMGCKRLLGYIDCKPRYSWYTPSTVSALFLLRHTSDTWRIKWGPWTLFHGQIMVSRGNKRAWN